MLRRAHGMFLRTLVKDLGLFGLHIRSCHFADLELSVVLAEDVYR